MNEVSRYLLGLYRAEREQSPPISSGHVADRMDRSPAATTEMFQRLEENDLVTYEPYEGATLTEEGRHRAEEVHDSFVTLSRFFRDVLDVEDHEQEAIRVAGSVSPTVTERLAATLLSDD
ncbi:metal-dependent transcriptional regulator [Haloarchaeobius amylolyticus]|uniref:metal-dependent transcriptional regulator n=1 Tax=Haloarchaeobius amylolyticus TaxID=1198296 RepID=UPI00226F618C|nr:metal-dependent transcriptional regulator [Haloarchaeobius amylolyticus]